MRLSLPRPFARSLSLRLLAIFIVTGLACLIVLILLSSHGLSGQWRRSIQPHLQQYVAYVQQDLGDPPSIERADAIAASVPVDIALYRGSEFVHATDGWRSGRPDRPERFRRSGPRDLERLRFRALPARLTRRIGAGGEFAINNDRRHPVLRVGLEGWTVYYQLDARRRGRPSSSLDELAIAIAALGLILLVSWWAIRRQLRPVGTIKRAVGRMAEGDLDSRAALAGRDDLADLGNSIDALAARLKTLLDSKRELLLAVSHELKSPLTRLRLALEMTPATVARARLIDEIGGMSTLIDDLLETERLQDRHVALRLRTIDVGEVLGAVVDSLRRGADAASGGDPMRIDLRIGPGELHLPADETRLALLLRNLIRNALTHGRDPDGRADVQVSASRSGDDIVVTVTDRGPGIDEADRERVLEPFERLDVSRSRRTGGTGLGLALADGIARAHGGELRLSAAKPTGVMATVKLPSRPEPEPSI